MVARCLVRRGLSDFMQHFDSYLQPGMDVNYGGTAPCQPANEIYQEIAVR
jgi:hypothetical protein